jgi:hypothetical protein
MRISWDKTFCSERLAIFLNEIRMYGRTLNPGLRSVMRVSNTSDSIVPSLPSDLDYLESTVRGAIVAGACPLTMYLMYFWYVKDSIRRWASNRGKIKSGLAILAYLPRRFGGLGIQSLITLMSSTSVDPILEGVGCLKLIGYRFPSLRQTIMEMLPDSVEPIENEDSLPTNFKIDRITLRDDRILKALDSNLHRFIMAPVLKCVIPDSILDHLRLRNLLIESGSIIPHVLQEFLLELEPVSIFRKIANKFLRSRTTLSILSFRRIMRIKYANLRDARQIINPYISSH